MPRTIKSILNFGSGGMVIEAECHLSNSLPGITIVGLGNKAVDEARERVRSAFASCNVQMPRKRIIINLAPADVPKESTSLDLAIALSILCAGEQIQQQPDGRCAVLGELGLNGDVRGVRGIIGKLLVGKKEAITRFYVPAANLEQALLVPGIQIIPVRSLQELLSSLNDQQKLHVFSSKDHRSPAGLPKPDPDAIQLADIVGQAKAKRAIEIAAAGGHNILLSGPPGTGKSMLAKALPSVLPHLKPEEMLEITHLHSLVGNNYEQLVTKRPFRSPHHSASHVAVVGGGAHLRPGEVSLAHRGVLFLDELPEFNRSTIEALRQPLEDRCITVSRAKESALYPASFILVGTANPCPCGNFGTKKTCICLPHHILQYRQKLSGPILDRIDICVDVEEIDHTQLLESAAAESDATVRRRIQAARSQQQQRYDSPTKLNADATNKEIKNSLQLTADAKQLLDTAAAKLELSARSYMRLIKVSRTIADLELSDKILPQHVGEAIQYRAQNNLAIV